MIEYRHTCLQSLRVVLLSTKLSFAATSTNIICSCQIKERTCCRPWVKTILSLHSLLVQHICYICKKATYILGKILCVKCKCKICTFWISSREFGKKSALVNAPLPKFIILSRCFSSVFLSEPGTFQVFWLNLI